MMNGWSTQADQYKQVAKATLGHRWGLMHSEWLSDKSEWHKWIFETRRIQSPHPEQVSSTRSFLWPLDSYDSYRIAWKRKSQVDGKPAICVECENCSNTPVTYSSVSLSQSINKKNFNNSFRCYRHNSLVSASTEFVVWTIGTIFSKKPISQILKTCQLVLAFVNNGYCQLVTCIVITILLKFSIFSLVDKDHFYPAWNTTASWNC